eukprot:gb/GECH01007111.1/.p1 GENE.gb/GECH01007111.1/~~gb/GECH01007111.1/.p1  ORF type:complete len:302 (+),score=101.30 gb/GECH01007111.1/:1-906(+)
MTREKSNVNNQKRSLIMNDRLSAIKQGNDLSIPVEDESEGNSDPLWEDVSNAKANISRIKTICNDMDQIAGSATGVSDSESQLDSLIEQGNNLASETKNIVFRIKDESAKYKKMNDDSMARIAENQYRSLATELSECIRNYENTQKESREKIKATLKRQVQIATGKKVSDEEAEEMYGMGTDVFKQSILPNTSAYATARVTFDSALEKHHEIQAIETSLEELHEMFNDLALLVDQQSDVIDTIQSNVSQANENVVKGTEEMQKARRSQKSSRKKMCCVLLLVVIILAVIIAVIAIFTSIFT